jgi:hypothetical protein
MNVTKLIVLGAISLGSATAMPVSAFACGGGPATAAQLEYLRSVEERPAESPVAANTPAHTRAAEPGHHAAGRRHASASPRRASR